MSKRPKHLRRLWKRSSTFTKVLTAFVTLAMVLEMFPAQSVAYARQVVFEAVGVDPAVLVQPVEPEEEAPAAAETPAETEEVVVEETEPAEAVEAEDEVVVPEDQTEPAAETKDQGEAVVEETEVAPAPEEETKADEAEVQPEAEVKPEEPKAEEPKAEDKNDEAAKPEYPAQTLQTRLGNTIITVTADQGSLPAGSKVVASWYDTGAVQEAVEAAAAAEGKTVDDMVAIDVTILDANGNEVQPNIPVQVKFLNAGVQGDDISVYHIEHETGEATPVATDVANSVTQRFVADGFSVYVVVNKDEVTPDARLTVNFVIGETTKSMSITKNQLSEINQYIYDPGVGDLAANEMFKGWTDVAQYTTSTGSMTIADVRDAVAAKLNGNIAEGDSLTYYAMIFKAFDITYQDEKGVTVKNDQVVFRADEEESEHPYTVNLAYTPYANDEEEGGDALFKGWELTEPVPSEVTVYENGQTLPNITGNMKLRAKVDYGYWLSFNDNLRGASYTTPLFVEAESGVTVEPSKPTRTGYTFNGWYTEDASSERDGQVAGNEFSFGGKLTENTVVYGKWTQNTTASYSVIIWQQNIDGKTYDFKESVTISNAPVGSSVNPVTATSTGARINGTNYSYEGFHLGDFDHDVTVNAEGNTVVNVYFDRTEYTLTFRRDRTGTVYKTITALYGQNIGDNFPITDNGASAEWRWSPQDSDTFNQVLVYVDIMPAEDVTFYRSTSTASTKYMEFYVEALPGQTADRSWNGKRFVKLGNTLTAKYNFFTEAEDFLNLTGFEHFGSDPAFVNGRADVSTGGTIRFYYTRNSYDIIYRDGVYTDHNGAVIDEEKLPDSSFKNETDILYQADISDKGDYAPTRAGYVFLGWYADDKCQQEYDFDTMPSHNVTVYAKWVAVEYNVTLTANDSDSDPIVYTDPDQSEDFHADYDSKVGNVGGTRVGYDLVGWYADENLTKAYDFDVHTLNETTIANFGNPAFREADRPSVVGQLNLYAKWRSKLDGADGIHVVYDETSDGVEGSAPTDDNRYVDLAEAIVGPASTAKDGDMVFSNWVVQKWDNGKFIDTDERLFPGDTFVVKAADARIEELSQPDEHGNTKTYTVQLRAEYIEKDRQVKTHINWYKNTGEDAFQKDEDISINQGVAIPGAPTRDGYTFLGWAKVDIGTTQEAATAWEKNSANWTQDLNESNLVVFYDGEAYHREKVDGPSASQVAADEKTPYNAMFAVWKANNYKVKFDKNAADATGTMADQTFEYDVEQALTANAFTRTNYKFLGWSEDPAATTATHADKQSVKNLTKEDGGEVTLYAVWELDVAPVTVHHYLKGTTTEVADDVTDTVTIGTEYTATPVAKYQEKDLTVDSYNPSQKVTVAAGDNVITIYYTLPLKITAKTDSKTYDGKPLAGEYTVEGALTADEAGIKTALGTAPSITNVSESPKEYQAATDGIPGYYVITNTPGTLTIKPADVTITTGSDSKEYDGTALTNDEATITGLVNGETATVTATGSQIEVGSTENTYSIDWGNTDKNNYTVSEELGTLEVTESTAAVKLTAPSDSKTYDGTALTAPGTEDKPVTATGLPEGFTIQATATGSQTDAGESANVVNDGYKILDATGADKTANFTNVEKVDGTLTVNPKAVTITTGSDSKAYDGTPLTKDEATIEGLVEGESVTLKATGTITEVGSTDNTYSITWDKANKDNYTVTENLGKLTITQSDAQVVLTAASSSKTYDGKALADATVTATGLPEGFTYEATASGSQTDAGESANVINDGYKFFDKDGNDKTANFTKVQKVDGKLAVNPKAVTITTGSDSKAYDGTPLTKDEATIEGLVEGESVTLKATGTITEVGSTDNTYSITWDKAKEANYTVTENLGTLTITQNSSEVTLTAASGEKTYDGEALTDATVTADGLPEGFTYEATASGSQTDAGSSKNVVNDGYKFFDKDGNDKTANFTNVKKVDGTLTVNPAPVTITTGSDSKAYDGTPLTKDEATIEGLVEGESVTLKATGTITEVGDTPNTYSITWDKAKEDNYTVTDKLGTLEITKNDAAVTLTAPSDSKTYDGTALTADGKGEKKVTATGLPEGFTVEATATGSQTDAGSSKNVVDDGYVIKNAAGENKTASFTNVTKVDGTLEVTKRTVTLTSGSDSKIYDGTALTKPEVTVAGDGFVAGEVTDIKATGTITEVGKVTNTITYTEGAAFKADNYNITKTEGELEITAVTEKVTVTITENSGTEKYDGTEKTVTGYKVTSISNDLYKEADFTFTGNDTVKGTDAGKYAMELKSDDFTNTNKNFANVEFVIIDGELTIEPRKVTLTSATDEKQYDGNPLTNDEVTVSEDGFVEGQGATYDVTGTQTLVGSSENTFTYTLDEGTNAKNYTITTVNGTLTVINRDAKFEVTVKANSETATYDGKDHSAKGFETLTFDVEGNTYTVSGLTTEDPSKVDAGEYTNNITGAAVVKDAKGNDVTKQFAVHTENGKLVINKLEVVIKSGTAEKQYDGKALTNDEITYPKPFVEGEGAIITMTGTQTLVGTSDNSFEYKLRDNTKADNYTISTEFGTLTVTDRETPLEITVVSKSDEVTYDGAEHTVSGFETLEFTIDGVKFTVESLSAEGKGTDAGTYPNAITGTAVVKDADGNDVTAQFEVKQTEGKLVINPVSAEVVVTITEHSGEYEFDNTEKTVTGYDVTKISNNLYTDKDFSFSGDATVKGTEAGTYDMELKPADFKNESSNFTNVKFEIVDGQLVITPKSIDDPDDPGKPNPDLTVEGPEDTVYNGLEQKQPVKVTDSKTGETLVEGEDFTLTYGDDMTNVGEVPVKVTGINNYKGEFDLSYKITPAPLKVTTSSAQKVYDATPLTSAEYEIEGLVNGETLDVKTTGSQTLVGESLNTAEITWADKNQVVTESINANLINLFAAANPTAKSTNYTLSVELGTLTVTDDGVPTDLVVKKTHEGTEFGLGETVTFTLTATNIYDEARDITFVEIEGVEVEQATFQKVPAGETVTTKATYVVTEADILAGEFKNEVTVKIGDAEHGPADDTVVIEKKNPHMTVTKTVVTAEPAAGFKKGDKIEYKIVVLNDGNVTISDIKVTDELTGDEWAVESLEPGKSAEFSASYTVTDADVTAGSVTNTATATGKDPDGDEPTVTPGTAKSNIAKPVKVKKRLPQTSDPTSIMAIEALATAGLASIASGLALLRSKQKHDDEE